MEWASAQRRAKAAAKRSKWLVVLATIAEDLRSRWAGRRGPAPSTSGSTHRALSLEESLSYVDAVLADYLQYGQLSSATLTGKQVLELGPGDNYGVALRFLASGAERVVSVDRFASIRDQSQQREIYAALIDGLEPDARATLGDSIEFGDTIGFDQRRLKAIEGLAIEDADAALEAGSFDLIVSRAVLEHLQHPDSAFAAMDHLLKPGGSMLHRVDFRDHGMFTGGGLHPLTFLTIRERVYRWMTQHSGRPNRRLIDWYRSKLGELGYDTRLLVTRVVGVDEQVLPHPERYRLDAERNLRTIELIAAIRPRLRPEFQRLSDEDLAVAGIFVVARKPGRAQTEGSSTKSEATQITQPASSR